MDGSGKILVTGATGFIGTQLVWALAGRGHRVRALSRRRSVAPPGFDWPDGGPLNHENVELVLGDVTDRDSLARAMEGCSHVFHLAGYAKNWARDPQTYVRINVEGTRNVLDLAQTSGVRRVVVTSTELTLGPTRRGQIADEEAPRLSEQCFTEYERTKLAAEREALARAAAGLPVVVVNPSRVYGPGHLTEGNSISLLVDQYDRGQVPFLLNRGINVGNWVFIDDVVHGHLLAMEKGRLGQRYLLGGQLASLKEFFRLVDEVTGRRHFQIPLLCFAPMVFARIMKKRADWFNIYPPITPGWVKTFAHDWARTFDKTRRELGYQPRPLAEGLRITWEWLQRVRSAAS